MNIPLTSRKILTELSGRRKATMNWGQKLPKLLSSSFHSRESGWGGGRGGGRIGAIAPFSDPSKHERYRESNAVLSLSFSFFLLISYIFEKFLCLAVLSMALGFSRVLPEFSSLTWEHQRNTLILWSYWKRLWNLYILELSPCLHVFTQFAAV